VVGVSKRWINGYVSAKLRQVPQVTQVAILAWLLMTHVAAAAETLAQQEIDAELIDVRSLSPIDWACISESVNKTGRVIIAEEGPITGGVGAELAAGCMERFPDALVAPIGRVASPDIPVPFAPVFENTYRPDPARVCQAVQQVLAY